MWYHTEDFTGDDCEALFAHIRIFENGCFGHVFKNYVAKNESFTNVIFLLMHT